MTARQLALEVQNQCHVPRDGGHYMTEYHDLVFMLHVISNMLRNMHEKNGVTRDIIFFVRVIST